jgi:hypothetical protein
MGSSSRRATRGGDWEYIVYRWFNNNRLQNHDGSISIPTQSLLQIIASRVAMEPSDNCTQPLV